MAADEKIRRADLPALKIVHYGDPRLREVCTPVEVRDESLRRLADRMFELLFQARGVGLAACQVGVTVQLFVASPSAQEDDRRVYVNPRIVSMDGWQESEEGCLSIPGVSCKIKRRGIVTVQATDLAGKPFEETGQDLTARIFQHEIDHLNGQLIVDRMGSLAKMARRHTLKELEHRCDEDSS